MDRVEINTNIKKKLLGTNRVGIKNLIEHMERDGFFVAPASGRYHMAFEGGLAEHSLNVCNMAHQFASYLLSPEEYADMYNSITICALLHDIGKMGDFKKPYYVEKLVRSKSKNKETGEYDMVRSEAEPFAHNSELMYIDHEISSIKVISRFIDLTEEETNAILWHNGLYGKFKYDIPSHETKLYMIIHWADMWASRVIEEEKESEE